MYKDHLLAVRPILAFSCFVRRGACRGFSFPCFFFSVRLLFSKPRSLVVLTAEFKLALSARLLQTALNYFMKL